MQITNLLFTRAFAYIHRGFIRNYVMFFLNLIHTFKLLKCLSS